MLRKEIKGKGPYVKERRQYPACHSLKKKKLDTGKEDVVPKNSVSSWCVQAECIEDRHFGIWVMLCVLYHVE